MFQYLGYITLSFFIVYLCTFSLYSMLKENFGIEIPLQGEILLTKDSGEKWAKIKNPTQEALGIDNFVFDPDDPENIYIATVKGIFQTKGGKERQQKEENFYLASAEKVSQKEDPQKKEIFYEDKRPILISKFIYDYKNKNILYFISEEVGRNKLYRSCDGGENFEMIFVSQKNDKITALEPSSFSSKILYIGTGKGQFLKSDNYGNSWEKRGNFSGKVKKIGVNPASPDEVYVITSSESHPTAIPPAQSFIPGMVMKSADFGDSFKNLELSQEVDEVVFAQRQNIVYFVSKLSIFQIEGEKIKELNLPSGEGEITAFTIDPKNSNILYLGQGEAFFRSYKEGSDWEIIELPLRGKIEEVKINSQDSSKIMVELAKTL